MLSWLQLMLHNYSIPPFPGLHGASIALQSPLSYIDALLLSWLLLLLHNCSPPPFLGLHGASIVY